MKWRVAMLSGIFVLALFASIGETRVYGADARASTSDPTRQSTVPPESPTPVGVSSDTTLTFEAETGELSGTARVDSDPGRGSLFVSFGEAAAPTIHFQPNPPFHATFYDARYRSPESDEGWSGWQENNKAPPASWASHYLPDPNPERFDRALELYSSIDPELIAWQLGKMAEANLEVGISAWWGRRHKTDSAFDLIVNDVMTRAGNPYPNFRWALQYELETVADPAIDQIASDLQYIVDNYVDARAYLRVDDRPVLFVRAGEDDTAHLVQRWVAANQMMVRPFYLVLEPVTGFRTLDPQPDSWYGYRPTLRFSSEAPYFSSASPGYWHAAHQSAKLPRSVDAFRDAVTQMDAVETEWKLITTWNSWQEGSAVEPGETIRFDPTLRHNVLDATAPPFKNAYVDVLEEVLPALSVGTGVTDRITAAAGPTAADGFVFAAAGDIGATANTRAMLQSLQTSDAEFFLALGDLMYNNSSSESEWCAFISAELAEGFPFQLLVGNHEDEPTGDDGFIDRFVDCMPDRLGVKGQYGHRYYFDYPAAQPLARFILIDPAIHRGASIMHYCRDGEVENCNWLRGRIQEAHNQGLWVIVGMHYNCLTLGEQGCAIGDALMNMLTQEPVDLIFHGHEHAYLRTKQLALNANCPTISRHVYNASCIADTGDDNHYEQGRGPVWQAIGTGGVGLLDIFPIRAESGYFASWMGRNVFASFGYARYVVTAQELRAEFISTTGDFADAFTIERMPDQECTSVLPTNGAVSFQLQSTEPGTFQLWSRAAFADAEDAAFWIQIDDGCPQRLQGVFPAGQWGWAAYSYGDRTEFPLSLGPHTIRVAGESAYAAIDKLVLTSDVDCKPIGQWADECEGQSAGTPQIPDQNLTLYLSASTSGVAGNVTYADEDIIAYDTRSGSWYMLFDGSDVGLAQSDVNGAALLQNGSLLLTFNAPTTVPNIGEVEDTDIVRFIPASLGTATAGRFALFLRGARVGLSTVGEDLNGLYRAQDGSIIVSSATGMVVDGARWHASELASLSPPDPDSSTPRAWKQDWLSAADGLQSTLPEGIHGVWINETSGAVYLAPGVQIQSAELDANANDLLRCSPADDIGDAGCAPQLFWNGNAHGFAGTIDALFLEVNSTLSVISDPAGRTPDAHHAVDDFDPAETALFLPFMRAP